MSQAFSNDDICELLRIEESELSQIIAASGRKELIQLISVLSSLLLLQRIPEVVRRPDSWLGGRSILTVLRMEGTAPILAYIDRLRREDFGGL